MRNLKSRSLNRAWYYWRRNNWMVDPRRLLSRYTDVVIDRPVFLLGNQGDGLTFVSRMIRRHPSVVSVTGDHRYWTGADEIQNVMRRRLPPSLALPTRSRFESADPRLAPPHSWSYACDDLLPYYRASEEDYDPGAAERFQRLVREALAIHGSEDGAGSRFVDKSQSYTVKARYVAALLRGADPHFILITRNPYATCYRAALGKAGDMERYATTMSLGERFEICVQHWSNSMRCVVEDSRHLDHFAAMALEDILVRPEAMLREVCAVINLPFGDEMVPRADQRLPIGSKYLDRWFPLRPDVNDRYLEEIPRKYVQKIADRCGELAASFGYHPPRGG